MYPNYPMNAQDFFCNENQSGHIKDERTAKLQSVINLIETLPEGIFKDKFKEIFKIV